jgi:hypothetical protein
MPQYRFEIVGRAFERFTWRLVELRGTRRRVLARDDQDYSTLVKVEEAIAAFRVIVGDAEVVNTTLPGATPFPLPPTSFEFVDGVVPLVVEESPEEDDELSEGPLESAHKEPERQEPVLQAAEPQEPERKEQPAEPARQSRQRAAARASTTTRERATRSSGGRRRKGT